jgi:hypothetical protein
MRRNLPPCPQGEKQFGGTGECLNFVVIKHQGRSYAGGHEQKQGTVALEKVLFSANGFTPAWKAQDFALYRAAELAQSKNKPYFVIYESLLAAAHASPSDRARIGTVGGKPLANLFVLYLDKPRPGAKETALVLKELDSVVHPPKKNEESQWDR